MIEAELGRFEAFQLGLVEVCKSNNSATRAPLKGVDRLRGYCRR